MEFASYPSVPVLPYDVAMLRFKSGDLVLFSGSSKFNEATKKMTDSVWTHSAFLFLLPVDEDAEALFESVEGVGVRSESFRKYVEENATPERGKRIFIARHSALAGRSDTELASILACATDAIESHVPYDHKAVAVLTAQSVPGEALAAAGALVNPDGQRMVARAMEKMAVKLPGTGGRAPSHKEIEALWERAAGQAAEAIKTNNAFVCSEFVARCFATVGVDFPASGGRSLPTPRDIAAPDEVHAVCEVVPQ